MLAIHGARCSDSLGRRRVRARLVVDRRSGELAGVPTTRQEARQGVGEQCQAGTGREDVCVCMCVYLCCVLCVAIFCVRGVGASVLCTMRQAGCLVWESAVIRAARRSGPTCICWHWHWHWHWWETKELKNCDPGGVSGSGRRGRMASRLRADWPAQSQRATPSRSRHRRIPHPSAGTHAGSIAAPSACLALARRKCHPRRKCHTV